MELTKEISYDKNLIQNNNFTLKYSGQLFQNNSEEVFIVYGYDKDWKNTTEQKMEKQQDCFSVNINIQEFDKFNFCFKNSLNIWDNNNGSDYHLPIIEQENIEFNSELNELLDQILNEVKTPSTEQKSTQSFEETVSYFEKLFDELFSNYQKSATVEENAEINVTNTQEEKGQQDISYYEALFDELFVNSNQIEESVNNLDLIETFPEEFETLIQPSNIEIKEEQEIQDKSTLALTTTSKRKSIFAFENLSPLYVLGRRLRLAFYKLIYVLPAFLFGEEEDSEN